MMSKNDVKYLFRSTCHEIDELVLVSIGFSKELLYKDNRDVRFLKIIVMMVKTTLNIFFGLHTKNRRISTRLDQISERVIVKLSKLENIIYYIIYC